MMPKKTVCVMMSTYNGERFIREQLESILAQEDVDVTLYVRDDGSTDGTIDIINSIRGKKVYIERGNNWGYKKSFFYLMKNVPLDYDYYAFADQDDFWLPDKLITAVSEIDEHNGCVAYCTSPCYVDEKLQSLKNCHSIIDDLPYGLVKTEWAVATCIFGLGCTFVWNKNLQSIIHKDRNFEVDFCHDNFLAVMAALLGKLIHSENSKILYRQHGGNCSGNKQKTKSFFSKIVGWVFVENNDLNYKMREYILQHYSEYIEEKQCKLLELSTSYRWKWKKKFMLLRKMPARGLNRHEQIKFCLNVLTNRY